MRVAVVAVVLGSLAACGEQTSSLGASGNADRAEELVAVATVLQDAETAELCLGGVAESLPPQCEGPPIVGWDWASVAGEQRAGGVTWGEYVVVGTYDGSRFTTTRPAVPREDFAGTLPAVGTEPDLSTPCPEPAGGWRVVDGSLVSPGDLEHTLISAQGLDGMGEVWLDQSVNPAADDPEGEAGMNDPRRLVLNVSVTGDAGDRLRAERVLRRTWGGSLCVSEAVRAEAELLDVQRRLTGDVPGALGSNVIDGVVELVVVSDDGALQAALDERYGAGLVRVTSALQPYTG